jgi:hypothetical protein
VRSCDSAVMVATVGSPGVGCHHGFGLGVPERHLDPGWSTAWNGVTLLDVQWM